MGEFRKINIVRVGGRPYMLLPNTLDKVPDKVKDVARVFEPASCGDDPKNPPEGLLRGRKNIDGVPTCYREVKNSAIKARYIGVPSYVYYLNKMRAAFKRKSQRPDSFKADRH